MKAGYLQYDVSRDRETNLRLIEATLPSMRCDLVVLPELCLCGYLFSDRKALASIAEGVPGGLSTQKMLSLSKRRDCALVFGLAEEDNGKIYNTAVVVDRGRFIGRYRKIHLTDYEKRFFDRGTQNEVFALRGYRLGVQICFDLWFPEISREQLRQGADLFCALANFGGETTSGIARTRAIENLTPLILCNRVGSEKEPGIDADFRGDSAIIGPDGTVLSQGKTHVPDHGAATIEIACEKANAICSDFQSEIALHAR